MLNTSLTINSIEPNLRSIVSKIISEQRISEEEGLLLYTQAPLALLGSLANSIREKKEWK